MKISIFRLYNDFFYNNLYLIINIYAIVFYYGNIYCIKKFYGIWNVKKMAF